MTTSGAVVEDEQLKVPLKVTFLSDQIPPYNVVQYLTLGEWEMLNSDGIVIEQERIEFESGAVLPEDFEITEYRYLWKETQQSASGRSFSASLVMSENLAKDRDLKLRIYSFYGHSKGDAPLEIKENWEIDIPLNKDE